MFDELLIRWTVRIAVACYAARLICDSRSGSSAHSTRLARWWWTAGCFWFVLHVAAAFHLKHSWSHSAAYADTASRTAEMTGWKSGIGLYFNDLFLLVWVMDTLIWWRWPDWPCNRFAYWTVQGIFAFLFFQATVVFGPWFWKPIVGVFLTLMVIQHSRKSCRPATHDPSAGD